jgi:LysR family transcriptional regulator, hydrogen peroxide-inducible genes activator
MGIGPTFDPRATTIPVLRYLVAVADHGNFARAARACAVAQPTLSAQVAQWERRMRVQVFERTAAGVRSTRLGEQVIAQARDALAALQRVEDAASAGKPPFFGPVRFGVIPTIGPYALPLVAPAIEAAFPELELPIHEAQTDALLSHLDAGLIDVALVAALPGMDAGRIVEDLYEEPFAIALPRRHPLAGRERIGTDELAQERVLLLDEGHCLRDQALELCRLREGAQRRGADYRATSLETLRQLVAAGIGCTVLPALAIDYGGPDERVVVRPLALRRGSRTIALAWRTSDGRADAYRQLSSVIRRAIPRDRLRLR